MNIADALLSLRPGAEWVVRGTEIEWLDSKQTQPTDAEIQAEIAHLQADYEANQYQRERLAEYPSIQECIHAILDDDLEALQAKRSAVKAKYPKPE